MFPHTTCLLWKVSRKAPSSSTTSETDINQTTTSDSIEHTGATTGNVDRRSRNNSSINDWVMCYPKNNNSFIMQVKCTETSVTAKYLPKRLANDRQPVVGNFDDGDNNFFDVDLQQVSQYMFSFI